MRDAQAPTDQRSDGGDGSVEEGGASRVSGRGIVVMSPLWRWMLARPILSPGGSLSGWPDAGAARVAAIRLGERPGAVPQGEAEGVADGIGVDQAVVGVRLGGVSGRSRRQHPRLRGGQVVDEEVEVDLHRR